MHFKGPPWDFLRKHSGLLEEAKGGLWGIYCFDFYLQKILLNRMGLEDFSIRWGEDATFDWFRDNVVNGGLFSANGNYFVYNAERLAEKVREAILRHSNWGEQAILLCFSKKDKFLDEISKVSTAKVFHIEAPRFWEGEKLLDFLCEQMKLRLAYGAKNHLLDAVPHKIPNFVQTLKFLSLNAPPGRELSLLDVEKLIEPKEINKFHLANLLSLKKFKEFYGVLVKKRADFDTYRDIFSFMQTHLLKLGDPGYTEKKSRLSKYDRDILLHSKNWSGEEIHIQLRRMGEWEIFAKKRDPFLIPSLRCSLVGFL